MSNLSIQTIPQAASEPTQFEAIFEFARPSRSVLINNFYSKAEYIRRNAGFYRRSDCIVEHVLSLRIVSKRLYHSKHICKILNRYSQLCFRQRDALTRLLVSPLQAHIQSIKLDSLSIKENYIKFLIHKRGITAITLFEIGSYNTKTGKSDYTEFNNTFNNMDITQFGILFAQVKHLTFPRLCEWSNIDLSIFQRMLLSCNSLTYVSGSAIILSTIPQLSDEQLTVIFSATITLDFSYGNVKNRNFIRLLAACRSLKFLDLSHCRDFGDMIAHLPDEKIIELFEKIECMNIEGAINYYRDPQNGIWDYPDIWCLERDIENRLKNLLPKTRFFGARGEKSALYDQNIPLMHN